MDHRRSEQKDPDTHTHGHDSARAHPSKPLFNATIGSSNLHSVCIFTKRKDCRKNQSLNLTFELNKNRRLRQIEFNDVLVYDQNTVTYII